MFSNSRHVLFYTEKKKYRKKKHLRVESIKKNGSSTLSQQVPTRKPHVSQPFQNFSPYALRNQGKAIFSLDIVLFFLFSPPHPLSALFSYAEKTVCSSARSLCSLLSMTVPSQDATGKN